MFDALRARFSRRPEAAAAQEPVRPPPGGYKEPFHVVVVGGDTAALEVTLALHAHAGDLVEIQLVAAEAFYAPASLGPYADSAASSAPGFALAALAEATGTELTVDRLVRIDAAERRIFTERRRLVDFDALVLCLGTEPRLGDGQAIDGMPRDGADGRIFTADARRAGRTARDVARLAGVKLAPDGEAPLAGDDETPELTAYLAGQPAAL